MKKLSILIALIGLSLGVYAQRKVNLKVVNIFSPVGEMHIKDSTIIPVKLSFTNYGPDSLKSTDTVAVYYGFNGNFSPYYLSFSGNVMHAWDTLTVQDSGNVRFAWSGFATDSSEFFGFKIMPFNRSADSVIDPDTTNNQIATSVILLDVNNVAPAIKDISIYPNPASALVNFNISIINAASVTIKVTDIVGRDVIIQNEGCLYAGQHNIQVNTSSLQDGMYICRVAIGNSFQYKKLYISK